jgi:hypothetical protein
MTSIKIPLQFSSIIPTARQPKQLGDYDYIDISYNTMYDISNNIIYDISNNMKFYKLSYYNQFLIACVNHVPIITQKDNYVYLFLLDLYFYNIPVCKIGFTSDVLDRTISLKCFSKIKMLLLAVIPVKGQFQETALHTYLKIKCPYCIMDYTYPNGTKATELYKLHPNLIKELYFYLKHLELINKNNLLIKQEETKQIKYMEETKQIKYMEETKQEQEKTKQEQEKTKQLELQLKILKLQQKK